MGTQEKMEIVYLDSKYDLVCLRSANRSKGSREKFAERFMLIKPKTVLKMGCYGLN